MSVILTGFLIRFAAISLVCNSSSVRPWRNLSILIRVSEYPDTCAHLGRWQREFDQTFTSIMPCPDERSGHQAAFRYFDHSAIEFLEVE